MVILLHPSEKRVLLQIPNNKLGWKYHFGCYDDENPAQQVAGVLGVDWIDLRVRLDSCFSPFKAILPCESKFTSL